MVVAPQRESALDVVRAVASERDATGVEVAAAGAALIHCLDALAGGVVDEAVVGVAGVARGPPGRPSAHPVWGPPYGLEPYAMAADVYGAEPWRGRGGWSWYTGAAGWLHRAAIESLFGLQMTHDQLWFEPCLPAAWPRATLALQRGGLRLRFVLHRGAGDAADGLVLRVGERLRWRGLPASSRFSVRVAGV